MLVNFIPLINTGKILHVLFIYKDIIQIFH